MTINAGPINAAAINAAAAVPPVLAYASAAGPLGALSAKARHSIGARMALASIFGAATVKAWNNSLGVIPATATTIYTCDIVNGAAVTRVPISSWQATVQSEGATFVQVVVPSVTQHGDAISAALESGDAEIVVYRGALFSDGSRVESEMARASLQTVNMSRGPIRYTATLSGYADAWTPDPDPPAVSGRALQDVRSISVSNGAQRVRCGIDWLLRPGLTATAADQAFVVGWINYYANTTDAYMDVGSAAA